MSRGFGRTGFLAAWLLLLAAALPAFGQAQGLSTRRLVHLFDFEEAKAGNFEDMPQFWFPIGRPSSNVDANFLLHPIHRELTTLAGYPRFAQVRFDKPQYTPGQHSLYLGLDGGNAGAFLEVGAVSAVPESEYLITARVKTGRLKRASARMEAYLVDVQGSRIEGSRASTEAIRTDGQWESVSVKILGDYKKAAWIGIQVELLQPTADPNSPLGNQQVVLEEVHGEAWFDDIAIWQIPHISVQTASPVNVLRAPKKPELDVQVRDLTGNALSALVTIYDEKRNVVTSTRRNVGDGAPEAWTWTPDLPSYGWYMADLTVYDTAGHGVNLLPGAIARSLGAFLWMPNESFADALDAQRFGLIADGAQDENLSMLPQLLEQTGIHGVTLSMWTPTTNLINLDERMDKLDELLGPLQTAGRQVTLSLSPVPRELAHFLEVDPKSPLTIFGKPIGDWRSYLAPILLRHGQGVRLWQMGQSNVSVDPLGADLGPLLAAADRGLQTLAPQPRIVLPWRLDMQRRRELTTPVVYQMATPWTIPAERIGDYLKDWRADPPVEYWLDLEEPPASEIGQPRRVADMALRMIASWEAGATGLTLTHPWADGQTHKLSILPDPVLGVFSSVAHRLAGRRAIGRMPLGRGLECVIFDGPAGGMLAAWNRSADPANAKIDVYLGSEPVVVDIWGNRKPVPEVNGRHQIALSTTPVFIEGVDPQLAAFRAAFTLTPPFIESTQMPHQRTITLANPWHHTISGTVTVLSPEDWRIDPRQVPFSIAGGDTTTIPIQLIFPISEVAGNKEMVVRFDFMADKHYRFEATAPMALGLKDIQFDASLSFVTNASTGKRDAVVTQLVTNTGDKPLSLYAFAQVTGLPRQEGIISQLRPRQSIIRKFHFADAEEALATQPVRVGLRETLGPAVLNKVLWASDAKK